MIQTFALQQSGREIRPNFQRRFWPPFFFPSFNINTTATMGRCRKELPPHLRTRICELKSLGYSHSRIHKLHLEVPLGTIKSTVRLESQQLENRSQPQSGQPRKLSEEQRDYIDDIINHTNPHATMQDLLNSVDNACKERSLQYLLHEIGKRKWIQRRRPLLTAQHAALRLQWA